MTFANIIHFPLAFAVYGEIYVIPDSASDSFQTCRSTTGSKSPPFRLQLEYGYNLRLLTRTCRKQCSASANQLRYRLNLRWPCFVQSAISFVQQRSHLLVHSFAFVRLIYSRPQQSHSRVFSPVAAFISITSHVTMTLRRCRVSIMFGASLLQLG